SAHGYSDGSSSLSFELLLTQPTCEPGSREIHGYEPSFLSDRVSDEASWGRGLARPRKPVVERSAGRETPSGRRASQDAKRNPACVVSGPVVHSVSNSPVAEAALRARDNPGERRSDVGGGQRPPPLAGLIRYGGKKTLPRLPPRPRRLVPGVAEERSAGKTERLR
ncbi:unnamed protein product, partial [Ixodes persulcatus]